MLRLGVVGLRPEETAFVRALLRLLVAGDKSVGWEAADAAPYDALVVGGAFVGEARGQDRPLLVLGDPAAPVPPTAQLAPRPLHPDVFREWLARTRDRLSVRETGPARAKLKRWPPAEIMRADPMRMRMATLLTRRALSAGELAQLVQCPPQRCEQFLHVLRGFALLEPAAPAPKPEQRAQPAARLDLGLVGSIRRRLGLKGNA